MSRYSYDSRSVAAAVAAALTACYPAVSPAQEGEQGAGKADASAVQEITVTGSRIVRRDLEAASPLVTVEDQAFEQNSTLAVESVLNKLPQYVPANTQF
ncbi:MAG TPA: hypothetical protein VG994_09895, partial [Steroidobacteraceae bacterium]|nr:hypothetical protein [Steroidobacteraceae bacterium]